MSGDQRLEIWCHLALKQSSEIAQHMPNVMCKSDVKDC